MIYRLYVIYQYESVSIFIASPLLAMPTIIQLNLKLLLTKTSCFSILF